MFKMKPINVLQLHFAVFPYSSFLLAAQREIVVVIHQP